MQKVFSFDAEADGLLGNPFAIAATVTSPDGVEVATFSLRLDNSVVTNEWVKEKVLPHIKEIEITPLSKWNQLHNAPVTPETTAAEYIEFLGEFAKFYLEHKTDAVIIAHCPTPVEAHLLREMHRLGLIGDWDGPYPLIGIEGLLDAVGENPTEATSYAEKHGLPLPEGSPHNPLYDCRLAATMYRHLKGW